jgi:hypothetical protein
MKATRLHARGGHESLRFEDAPTPQPGPGEVLVRVRAAAVTPTELLWVPTWATRDGSYPASVAVGPRQRLIVDYEIREDSRRITGYFVTFPEDW